MLQQYGPGLVNFLCQSLGSAGIGVNFRDQAAVGGADVLFAGAGVYARASRTASDSVLVTGLRGVVADHRRSA